jgi:hypothetical protein
VRDLEWAVPATVFVGIQFLIGLALASAIGFTPTPPVVMYLGWGAAVALFAALAWIVVEVVKMWRLGEESPSRKLLALFRSDWPKLLVAGYGCLLVGLQFASLTWLKSMLPLAVPFWADPYLAAFDKTLFGADPWKLLRPLPEQAETIVDSVYMAWFPIKAYTLMALLALPPQRIKSEALLAYFLTIGLFGVLGQFALSSAGPIFYHSLGFGSDFHGLRMTASVAEEHDYLWSIYQHRETSFGGGISAMPSVHVALAAWLALTLRSVWPGLSVVGWSFYCAICFGSVYLGWHYVADGLAGTAAALLSWKLSPAILGRRWSLPNRNLQAA